MLEGLKGFKTSPLSTTLDNGKVVNFTCKVGFSQKTRKNTPKKAKNSEKQGNERQELRVKRIENGEKGIESIVELCFEAEKVQLEFVFEESDKKGQKTLEKPPKRAKNGQKGNAKSGKRFQTRGKNTLDISRRVRFELPQKGGNAQSQKNQQKAVGVAKNARKPNQRSENVQNAHENVRCCTHCAVDRHERTEANCGRERPSKSDRPGERGANLINAEREKSNATRSVGPERTRTIARAYRPTNPYGEGEKTFWRPVKPQKRD